MNQPKREAKVPEQFKTSDEEKRIRHARKVLGDSQQEVDNLKRVVDEFVGELPKRAFDALPVEVRNKLSTEAEKWSGGDSAKRLKDFGQNVGLQRRIDFGRETLKSHIEHLRNRRRICRDNNEEFECSREVAEFFETTSNLFAEFK